MFSKFKIITLSLALFLSIALTHFVNAATFYISTNNFKAGQQDSSYIQTISTIGAEGVVNFAIVQGFLPTGLSLSDNLISGKPSVSGNYSVTLVASYDQNGEFVYSDPKEFTIKITPNTPHVKSPTPVIAQPNTVENTSDNTPDQSSNEVFGQNQEVQTQNNYSDTISSLVVLNFKQTFDDAKTSFKDLFARTKHILEIKNVDILTKIISVVGVVFAGIFSITGSLFANPLSFSELILIPTRLWSMLLIAFGFKKRVRPWGTVYDSVTKQPLDPVNVILYDKNNKEVATCITDIDGRYGFLVDAGEYKIVVKKTNYTFPSEKVAGETRDQIYLDLYFGMPIVINAKGDVLRKNIPMDPVAFDWNEFQKNKKHLMKFYSEKDLFYVKVTDFLFSLGFCITIISVIVNYSLYNLITICVYLFLIIIKEVGVSPKSYGRITFKDGTPLSFGLIHIVSAKLGVEITQKVLSKIGRYYLLVPNGKYTLKIDQKNPDESYHQICEVNLVEVNNGIINRNIEV